MRNVLIYGGSGALGRSIVSTFKKSGWSTIVADLVDNVEANHNITLNIQSGLEEQAKGLVTSLSKITAKVDAIICVAGGWAGGNASDKGFLGSVDLMMKQSVYSSAIAAHLASTFLNEGGYLLLTGANAAREATPGMIGYGMAKASVHHLVSSLAAKDSGLPAQSKVVCILPICLDTPMNRKAMPNADFSSWTPLESLSTFIYNQATNSASIRSGQLIEVKTLKGETTFTNL